MHNHSIAIAFWIFIFNKILAQIKINLPHEPKYFAKLFSFKFVHTNLNLIKVHTECYLYTICALHEYVCCGVVIE